MKKLILILLILFCSALPSSARMIIGSGPSGGPTYLINQNFEGTGYDNSESWTESGLAGSSVINEDYTSSVLRGSQSLYVQYFSNAGANYPNTTSPIFTATTDCWAFLRVRHGYGANGEGIFACYNGTTNLFWLGFDSADTGHMLVYYNGDLAHVSGTAPFAQGTTYFVWIHYIAGTGSNGQIDIYVGTSTTRPAVDIHITNSTATLGINKVQCGTPWDDADFAIYDQILVSASEIGDVDT